MGSFSKLLHDRPDLSVWWWIFRLSLELRREGYGGEIVSHANFSCHRSSIAKEHLCSSLNLNSKIQTPKFVCASLKQTLVSWLTNWLDRVIIVYA